MSVYVCWFDPPKTHYDAMVLLLFVCVSVSVCVCVCVRDCKNWLCVNEAKWESSGE